jgi:GTPase SAR1 family protein
VPIVLVGLKADLRNNSVYEKLCVPREAGKRLRDVGIVEEYVECSSKDDGKNITLAIEIALKTAIRNTKRDVRKKKCSIL